MRVPSVSFSLSSCSTCCETLCATPRAKCRDVVSARACMKNREGHNNISNKSTFWQTLLNMQACGGATLIVRDRARLTDNGCDAGILNLRFFSTSCGAFAAALSLTMTGEVGGGWVDGMNELVDDVGVQPPVCLASLQESATPSPQPKLHHTTQRGLFGSRLERPYPMWVAPYGRGRSRFHLPLQLHLPRHRPPVAAPWVCVQEPLHHLHPLHRGPLLVRCVEVTHKRARRPPQSRGTSSRVECVHSSSCDAPVSSSQW